MEEWAKQADEYDNIYNGGTWNKLLMLYKTMQLDHPYCAVRVREILKWGATEQYQIIKNNSDAPVNETICPNCGRRMDSGWKFCNYCGHKL